jgi:hypothetical protein
MECNVCLIPYPNVIFMKCRIILGGGVVKHHTCNANLMRNGAEHSVFINTGESRCNAVDVRERGVVNQYCCLQVKSSMVLTVAPALMKPSLGAR